MSTSDLAPRPGWYPDPVTPGQLRRWDGACWTSHTRASAFGARGLNTGRSSQTWGSPPDAGESEPGSWPESDTGFTLSSVGIPTLQADESDDGERVPRPIGPAAAIPDPGEESDDDRSPRVSAGVLVILILIFVFGGLLELAGGSSGKTDVTAATPGSATSPTTYVPGAAAGGAPTPGQSTVGPYLSSCAFAARRPSAARVVALLILGGLPLTQTSPLGASSVPPTTCTSEGFSDNRASGVDRLLAFPTAAAASSALPAVLRGSPDALAMGPIVVVLAPGLVPDEGSYRTALARIVALDFPDIPSHS